MFIFIGCNKSQNEDPIVIDEIPIGEFIDDWTFRFFPEVGDNFDTAEFRLWLPASTDNLKGIVILCTHYNGNGLHLAGTSNWKEFATNEQLAIVSVRLESINSIGVYTNASNGSGNALIKSIDTLSEKYNILKLKTLPFLMRGYSAGGIFSYSFSEFMPEKVIAFSNIRGGSLNPTSSINENVLGFMLVGELESSNINRIRDIVLSKRNNGAVWGYATEPNMDHFGNLTASDELTQSFFSIALNKRIISGSNQLTTVTEDSGWLGNNDSNEAHSFNTYPDDRKNASWLINEEFASKWKLFQLK